MQKIENEYQISKTIRFGLVQKKKMKKEGYTGNLYKSHSELEDLTNYSIEKVENSVLSSTSKKLGSLTDTLKICLNLISDFCGRWIYIYTRIDQISLDKEYYKYLCKKLKIKDLKLKKTIISLSQLDSESKDEKQCRSIINYWKSNIFDIDEKYEIAEEKLEQFRKATDIERTDYKPNEVELRKAFLSLFSAVKDILKPLYNGLIVFSKLETIDTFRPENEKIVEFALDYKQKSDLLAKIEEIEVYFKENGGNVPYCRATLNPKTIIKREKSKSKDITNEIKKLGIDAIIKNNKNNLDFVNKLYAKKDKRNILKKKDEGLVERGLLFKYIQIPVIIHPIIAKNISKSIGKTEEEIMEFLSDIGRQKSPAKDYADSDYKNSFNLDNYPIKVAFDFAWETLAKSIYHDDANLPIDECKRFLKEFNITIDDTDFKTYADLLELRNLLATLEYGNPTDKKTFIENSKKLVDEIEKKLSADNDSKKSSADGKGKEERENIGEKGDENKNKDEDKNKDKNKKIILNLLDNGCKKNNAEFDKVKKQIGLYRGTLKNNKKKYKEITEEFKAISMEMGKVFATIRDVVVSDTELNKTSHYAMIIEDSNCDRYVLLQEFTTKINGTDLIYEKINGHYDDFKAYYVNSITSSLINKILKKEDKENVEENGFRNKQELPKEKWKKIIQKNCWDYEFKLNLKDKEVEEIKKEIDCKGYNLVGKYINKDALIDLVKNKGCLLFPIINQDLAKEEKTENNQFTKDWNSIFDKNTYWRLTPEFRISYRKPTPNYPVSDKGDKRYSRFQMIAHFLCDYIPNKLSYISTREQLENYNDDDKWNKAIKTFHDKLAGKSEQEIEIGALLGHFNNHNDRNKTSKKNKTNEKFYVFGIDRGQNELATLCVIDQDKKIIGDFDIYIRSFNSNTKQWEHKFFEKRHILDLSNLRVETTVVVDGKPKKKKVLVDLSEIKVKDKNGIYSKPDKMQVKMQQLAYIRKLQFQMQTNPDYVLKWYDENNNKNLILANFVDKVNGEKGLVSFYGSAVEELEDTLPLDRIESMLKQFKELKIREKNGEEVKNEIDKLIQLEPVDNLKYGVVANMVGVVAHLLEKFEYNVYISLEDLTHAFSSKIKGGLSGIPIIVGKKDGKRVDVEKHSGLGLYNYFEIQLLKKLSRIQQNSKNIIHLVPSFRAVKNYEGKMDEKGKIKNRFGIVFFVNADSTSKTCPKCGTTPKAPNKKYLNQDSKMHENKWILRDKEDGKDILKCYVCGFNTDNEYYENPLKYIKSGDDSAAYTISAEAAEKAYELATTVIENK